LTNSPKAHIINVVTIKESLQKHYSEQWLAAGLVVFAVLYGLGQIDIHHRLFEGIFIIGLAVVAYLIIDRQFLFRAAHRFGTGSIPQYAHEIRARDELLRAQGERISRAERTVEKSTRLAAEAEKNAADLHRECQYWRSREAYARKAFANARSALSKLAPTDLDSVTGSGARRMSTLRNSSSLQMLLLSRQESSAFRG
jgi:hypothetical protein